MRQPERKKWDPQCPYCQEELQRHLELWKALFDEVDHGVVKGAQFQFEEHFCTHAEAPPDDPAPEAADRG